MSSDWKSLHPFEVGDPAPLGEFEGKVMDITTRIRKS